MHSKSLLFSLCTLVFLLFACERQPSADETARGSQAARVEQMGFLANRRLIEASGIQASHARAGDFFVHNDDGQPLLYAINEKGADLGQLEIVPAKNNDWEDLASVPVLGGRWIVAGDIGDNWAKRKSIKLYFAEEPRTAANDRYSGRLDLKHWLVLNYPDGPRDCEAMAYDPVDSRILLLSKRDKPPRLYGVDLETALSREQAELEFLGTVHPLRPPAPADRANWGGRTDWISQPTGLDISPDGHEAVVLTYRSLYRFRREPGEDWLSAMQRKPDELIGPPAPQNEAVAYSADGASIYVTTEKIPAPVFRIQFNGEQ
jgi:hypothetical protein